MLLYSRINFTKSLFADRYVKTSSEVEYWPVLVFFGLLLIFILSNKISPNCLGDEILNSVPASVYIFWEILSNSSVVFTDNFFKKLVSKLIPSISIWASVYKRGISISLYNFNWLKVSKSDFRSGFSCNTRFEIS